jgi:hypothetical protein
MNDMNIYLVFSAFAFIPLFVTNGPSVISFIVFVFAH